MLSSKPRRHDNFDMKKTYKSHPTEIKRVFDDAVEPIASHVLNHVSLKKEILLSMFFAYAFQVIHLANRTTVNGNMAGTKCPKCGFRAIRITRKSSYLQAKLLPSLGYYPWECAGCRSVFMAKSRGPRKKHTPDQPAPVEGVDSPTT